VIPLANRHTKERQYGKVFFSHEVRYLPLDKPVFPIRKIQPVQGYILEGKNKIFCDKRHYRNRLKGVLYKNKGRSILKELTEAGKKAELIFWNLELLRNDLERYPERNEGSIAREFFQSVKSDFNYSIEDWITSTFQQKSDHDDILWAQHLRNIKDKYASELFEEQVDKLEEPKQKAYRASSTIQNHWKKR
jgi:hypothetical protein